MTEAQAPQVEVATKEVSSLQKATCRWLQNPGIQVFLGVVVGLAAGITLAEVHPHANVIKVLSFPGKLWLKALTCVVLPMIICGMIQSMVMMRELPGAKAVACWVIALYGFTTVVAAVEGTAVSEFLLSTSIRPLSSDDLKVITPDVAKISTLDTILNVFDQLVPKNVVGDAAQNRLISVIMMSILVGLLIPTTRADGRRSSTLELVDEINEVVTKVIKFLIFLSPAGVCSLVFAGSARFNLHDMGTAVVALLGAVLASLGMHIFLFCPTLLAIGARRNPVKYFKNCLPPMLTALGSSSSAASLPLNIEVAIEKNGLSPHVAKFTLNLGATQPESNAANLDGLLDHQLKAGAPSPMSAEMARRACRVLIFISKAIPALHLEDHLCWWKQRRHQLLTRQNTFWLCSQLGLRGQGGVKALAAERPSSANGLWERVVGAALQSKKGHELSDPTLEKVATQVGSSCEEFQGLVN